MACRLVCVIPKKFKQKNPYAMAAAVIFVVLIAIIIFSSPKYDGNQLPAASPIPTPTSTLTPSPTLTSQPTASPQSTPSANATSTPTINPYP